MCARHQRRLTDIVHKASLTLAGLLTRLNIKTVIFAEEKGSLIDQFPWFDLRAKLSYKIPDNVEVLQATKPQDVTWQEFGAVLKNSAALPAIKSAGTPPRISAEWLARIMEKANEAAVAKAAAKAAAKAKGDVTS